MCDLAMASSPPLEPAKGEDVHKRISFRETREERREEEREREKKKRKEREEKRKCMVQEKRGSNLRCMWPQRTSG